MYDNAQVYNTNFSDYTAISLGPSFPACIYVLLAHILCLQYVIRSRTFDAATQHARNICIYLSAASNVPRYITHMCTPAKVRVFQERELCGLLLEELVLLRRNIFL